MSAVYLLGAPGVGKSTVLREVHRRLGLVPSGDVVRLHGLLRGTPLLGLATETVGGVMLGRDRPTFPGTDALSMSVHPDAVAWARSLAEAPAPFPFLVTGEGARLGTGKFLTAFSASTDLLVVHLRADSTALEARRSGRGSSQDPAWAVGAQTKAARAYAVAAGSARATLDLDTTQLGVGECAGRIVDALDALETLPRT